METLQVRLINEGQMQHFGLEMKWQDDGEKANNKDHDALHGELTILNTVMHKIWSTAQKRCGLFSVWQIKKDKMWQNGMAKYTWINV